MKRLGGLLCVSVFFTAALGMAATAGTDAVNVDCDAGDNLAKAISDAEQGGPYRIHISGTCEGSFTIEAERIELRGAGVGRAAIVSPEFETAIRITGASGVSIRDLEIRGGGVGVRLAGHDATASILFCDISADGVAVWVSEVSRAFLNGVDLHDSDVGLLIDEGSSGTLFFATTRDNRISGATVTDHSSLHVTNTEISGNGQVGLAVELLSTLTVHESTLTDNGGVHGIALDRSRMHFHSATAIGDEDDSTEFALIVDDMSRLQLNQIEVRGDVLGSKSSYLTLSAAAIHGDVLLDGFSNFRIFGAEVYGEIDCRAGADTICDSGSLATTDGCPSAPPVCGDSSPGAVDSLDSDDRVDPRADRLEKLLERTRPRKLDARDGGR